MIKTLSIKNFKSINTLSIENLGSLNLIVGKNNSGKSTVLEAIRILASNGSQYVINEIVESHDDNILTQYSRNDEDISIYEGLFPGRKFPSDDTPIYIGSINKKRFVEIKRVIYKDSEEEVTDENGNRVISRKRSFFGLKDINTSDLDIEDLDHSLQISTNRYPDKPSFISYQDKRFHSRRAALYNRKLTSITPISYIPTQFLSMNLLASLWDQAVLTPYYENVKKFLKIISDDFEDLAFIKVNNRNSRSDIERSGIIKLKNQSKPIPLNSMGDGVLRILQLVLGMFPAKGGFLLIDEFENGLHFSVQEKIWELLFDLSQSLKIQVFATTHSWDCIESFANTAEKNDSIDSTLFRLGKSIMNENKNEVIATQFNKEKLINLTQADVELR